MVASVELATGVHLPSRTRSCSAGRRRHPARTTRTTPLVQLVHLTPATTSAGQQYHGLKGAAPFRTSPRVIPVYELAPGAPLPERITYQAGGTVSAGIVRERAPGRPRAGPGRTLCGFAFVFSPPFFGPHICC